MAISALVLILLLGIGVLIIGVSILFLIGQMLDRRDSRKSE